MAESNTTLRAWAIPLGFQVFGHEIGDHTWVTGDGGYCDGCRFGVVPNPDSFYCGGDRWQNGKYVPPPNPPSRELGNRTGNANTAKCLGGGPYTFMGIPSQSGVVYAINGVCHTLSNRILYQTGLTVEGAAGYWFIKQVFGVYGTNVALSLIPPWIIFPIIPNPLYIAAQAVELVVAIEWRQIRDRCGVSLSSDTSEYLRAVDEIHSAPLRTAARETWDADSFFALELELHERHMREEELTIEHRGKGIDPAKLEKLLGLWRRVHYPVREHLDAFFAGRDSVSLRDLPPVQISEADALYLANVMNARAAVILEEVIDILGPEDFTKFYGHGPDLPFLVVEPDILRGAAK